MRISIVGPLVRQQQQRNNTMRSRGCHRILPYPRQMSVPPHMDTLSPTRRDPACGLVPVRDPLRFTLCPRPAQIHLVPSTDEDATLDPAATGSELQAPLPAYDNADLTPPPVACASGITALLCLR
jgi:hypothetical protein